MPEYTDSFAATLEFDDDASYSWWRDAHPRGFVLAVRAGKPPVLHHSTCSDVDRDRHPRRLKAKGSRQLCADSKSALRTWHGTEVPEHGGLIDRCPKCAP
ncbi:MAG TPA: hypothetical protein VE913_04220 [Longimicrobium sp.]|jgi:hypothetical protein|nr:hypothetical protein [Longimicrobium sp.]